MYKNFFDEVDRHLVEKVERIKRLNDAELKNKYGTDTAKIKILLAAEIYEKLEKGLAESIKKIIGTQDNIICSISYADKKQNIQFFREKTVVAANGLVTDPEKEISIDAVKSTTKETAKSKAIKTGDVIQSEISIEKYTNRPLDNIALHVFRKLVYEDEFFPIVEAFLQETTKGYADDSKFTLNDICKRFETAISTAVANEIMHPLYKDHVKCEIDADTKNVRLFVLKDVVELEEDVFDPDIEIWVEEAQSYKNGVLIGEQIEWDLDITDYGRVVAQTVKHVFRQGVSELSKDMVLKELQSKEKEIIEAKYISAYGERTNAAQLQVGNLHVYLQKSEQIPGETFTPGQMIQVYLLEVAASTGKSTRVKVSRTHPDFIKRLFEKEVTEISDGIVEIKSIAREAGNRTKIAVYSKDPDVDPVGACIGPKGARVNAIIEQLSGEKIDVIKYSENTAEYVTAALAPAEISHIIVTTEEGRTISVDNEQLVNEEQAIPDEQIIENEQIAENELFAENEQKKNGQKKELRSCTVYVPDSQLSLAIGNKGLNAKLATKLTGCKKIDIKPDSEYTIPI